VALSSLLLADRTMTANRPKIPPGSMRYATIGVEFIGIFLVLLGAGILADRRWQTSPIFVMVGMVAGFVGGMYRLLSVVRQYRRDDESAPPNRRQ